jgi:CRP-like cAMP-binding protein
MTPVMGRLAVSVPSPGNDGGGSFYAPAVSGAALPHFDAVPLFQCLNAEERIFLSPASRTVVYEKGTEIFREGEPATDLCFVVIGRVKIVKAGPERDVILGLFGAGEPIGAVALFEGKKFPASAVALEASTILRILEREFFATIDAHPEMTRRLLQGLMLRQFEISRRLADLTGSVEKRIARLLLMLATRVGRREGAGATIPLALSRQEIADLTATTVESAIRVMSRWGKENLVVTSPMGFSITDVQSLQAVTED